MNGIPYNRNIRRREILANRLNFPIGENLNWRNGILDHVTLWMPRAGARGETRPRTEVEKFTFLVLHSF